jgi:hypothetical protein
VIGVYGSGGAPWHHLALAALHGAEVRPLRAEDVAAGRLAELDALVMPGGGALAMAGMLAPLGERGRIAIREWVEAGGTYVSSCAGSVLPLTLAGASEALLPGVSDLRMSAVQLANPGDATLGGLASPGVGEIRVRLDPSHPFAAGLPESVTLMHYNGPLFDLAPAPEAQAFAWPVAAEARFTAAEHFLTRERGGETTLERCVAAGAATGLEVPVGRGRAILFGSHPEFGLGPLLLGWGAGAQLLVNALASCSAPQRRPKAAGDGGWRIAPEAPQTPVATLAHTAADELERIAARFESLTERDPGEWLGSAHAASFHGRSAAVAWCEDGAAAAALARLAADALAALASRLQEPDRGWLDDAPRGDQDFGAMGIKQLLARIATMLMRAEVRATEPPERPEHAYDLFDSHPFHLAVGSYLSAAGLVSAACLTVAILAARHHTAQPGLHALLWHNPEQRQPGRS